MGTRKEPTRCSDSNEYPQSMCLNRNKYTSVLLYKNGVEGGGVKLFRYVFVMLVSRARTQYIWRRTLVLLLLGYGASLMRR